jgi:hypothetical protein
MEIEILVEIQKEDADIAMSTGSPLRLRACRSAWVIV